MIDHMLKDDASIYAMNQDDFGKNEANVLKRSGVKCWYQAGAGNQANELGVEGQRVNARVYFGADPGVSDQDYLRITTLEGEKHEGRVLGTKSSGRPGQKVLWVVGIEELSMAKVP